MSVEVGDDNQQWREMELNVQTKHMIDLPKEKLSKVKLLGPSDLVKPNIWQSSMGAYTELKSMACLESRENTMPISMGAPQLRNDEELVSGFD
ncbi:hypothetical protein V6N12_037283 [Hibiscus sabdariffa]|uniref:Uncharacterized protein n=1 Tax=Hibiscus sabdariffa TaxID=183260 RepID=A0ABR2C3H0_9ROSI